jgi:nucleotide-binding universal stress UspA family protein
MMPPPKGRRFRTIVCGVDFSRHSAKALRYAAALARAGDGTVTAVTAIDPLVSTAVLNITDGRSLEGVVADELTAFVRAHVSREDAARIRCVTAIGTSAAVVIAWARRLRADLVVLGTHGRHGARRVLLGSTTLAVLRRFRGAVLVVPPHCPEPRQGWPAGSIVAAVKDGSHRRTEVAAAARTAESFGAWLSLMPATTEGQVPATRPNMIIYPLPRAGWLRMFRQGSDAYRFICATRPPVLIIRAGRRRAAARRAA